MKKWKNREILFRINETIGAQINDSKKSNKIQCDVKKLMKKFNLSLEEIKGKLHEKMENLLRLSGM
jgi:hypothetical protein